jgi:hypothetical protein
MNINLGRPVGKRKVRSGWGQWRTIFDYHCPAGHTVSVFCNSFRGKTPVPSVGAIECPQCRFYAKYPEYAESK